MMKALGSWKIIITIDPSCLREKKKKEKTLFGHPLIKLLREEDPRTTLEKTMRRSEEADFSSVERLERQSRASYLVNTSRKRSFREIRMAFRRRERRALDDQRREKAFEWAD